MSFIRVISKKILNQQSLTPLINQLEKQVKLAPGLVKIEYYWTIGDNSSYTAVSDWEDKTSWDKWFESDNRRKIINKDKIAKEDYNILIKKNPPNDIFLL